MARLRPERRPLDSGALPPTQQSRPQRACVEETHAHLELGARLAARLHAFGRTYHRAAVLLVEGEPGAARTPVDIDCVFVRHVFSVILKC